MKGWSIGEFPEQNTWSVENFVKLLLAFCMAVGCFSSSGRHDSCRNKQFILIFPLPYSPLEDEHGAGTGNHHALRVVPWQ
jgi:hypothetical protein